MASKQLGKLRQWGKEVISTKDKTIVTEEFKQLEKDVELRKAGIERIQDACSEYYGYIHKKKEYPHVEEGVKMLSIDALGVVMVAHGEEFGSDSAFGQCLTKFGRAQCKIATLQEKFASFVKDRYLSSLEKLLGDIEGYEMLRKKLDSRRLTYDAAVSKVSKAKKDKDIKEAEEEHIKAKLRYEEASSEVQTRMRRIQANELRQLRDLTSFLDNQIQFVAGCLTELREVEGDWCDESVIQRRPSSPTRITPHSFSHEQSRTIASVSRNNSGTGEQQSSTNEDDSGSEESGSTGAAQSDGRSSISRSATNRSRKSSGSKPPSIKSRSSSPGGSVTSNNTAHYSSGRPASRRKRSDSAASSAASSASESTRRSSGVTGWLSGSTRGKKEKGRKKDKDRSAMRAFASLENDSGGDDDDVTSQKSVESDSRSSINANSRKGGTLSRMFNVGMKGTSSNSSFAESRDVHGHGGSDFSHNSPLDTRMVDDMNSITPRLSSFNDSDASASASASLAGVGEFPGNGRMARKTNIAQRAEMEMSRTREYEPSINSMDDNMHTPLPSSTFPFVPYGGIHAHHLEDRRITDKADSGSEHEDVSLLEGPKTSNSSPFEVEVEQTDKPLPGQFNNSRVEIGNTFGQPAVPRAGPPPLPSRKSTKKVPPPPPPPPPPHLPRRSTPSPNTGLTSTGGSSSSLSLSGAAGSFPPPPPPRTRSTVVPTESLTISPFDN